MTREKRVGERTVTQPPAWGSPQALTPDTSVADAPEGPTYRISQEMAGDAGTPITFGELVERRRRIESGEVPSLREVTAELAQFRHDQEIAEELWRQAVEQGKPRRFTDRMRGRPRRKDRRTFTDDVYGRPLPSLDHHMYLESITSLAPPTREELPVSQSLFDSQADDPIELAAYGEVADSLVDALRNCDRPAPKLGLGEELEDGPHEHMWIEDRVLAGTWVHRYCPGCGLDESYDDAPDL